MPNEILVEILTENFSVDYQLSQWTASIFQPIESIRRFVQEPHSSFLLNFFKSSRLSLPCWTSAADNKVPHFQILRVLLTLIRSVSGFHSRTFTKFSKLSLITDCALRAAVVCSKKLFEDRLFFLKNLWKWSHIFIELFDIVANLFDELPNLKDRQLIAVFSLSTG